MKDIGNQYRAKQINRQATAASVVKEFLAGEDREVFLVLGIDNSNRINSINYVGQCILGSRGMH